MAFSPILNRVLSYTEYHLAYHDNNQEVAKRPATINKHQQIIKISLRLWESNELNADNNLGADYADYTDSFPVIQCDSAAINPCNPRNPRLKLYS